MYFFSDKKLARDLHKGIVTEKEQLFYFLVATFPSAFLMTITVGKTMFGEDSRSLSIYSSLGDIIYLASIFAAIIYSFKKNQSGDGKDFLLRYICLSAPIIVKATILGLFLGIISFFIDAAVYTVQYPAAAKNPDFIFTIIKMPIGPGYVVAMLITALYVFWRYINAFKIASGQKEIKG